MEANQVLVRESKLTDEKARPRTGVVLMHLRHLISQEFQEDWHAVARLRPVSDEDDADFQVYAITPQGREWVGDYPPTISIDEMSLIISDIKAFRTNAPLDPNGTTRIINVDSDGTPTVKPDLVGQKRTVILANGTPIKVDVRDASPKETEAQETSRIEAEVENFSKVMLMAEKYASVGYNGIMWDIFPGENLVPKPIADVYLNSVREEQVVRARMRKAVNFNDEEAYIQATRRGLR